MRRRGVCARRASIFGVGALVALIATACAAPSILVQVPDGPPEGVAIDFPDPAVQYVADPGSEVSVPERTPVPAYYAYGTGSFFIPVPVLRSPDLVHWTYVGDAFALGGSAWAQLYGNTWAPSLLQVPSNPADQRFVLYYTSQSRVAGTAGLQCIGRATASTPEGPFKDLATDPLVCMPERGGAIDPEPIRVGNTIHLLYRSMGFPGSSPPPQLWSVPLTPDGLSTAGTPALLLSATHQEFTIENPSMMPAPGGGFLLFYSYGWWESIWYATGVAWCSSVRSPCERLFTDPVLQSRDTMVGPGGGSVLQGLDGSWQLAFHAWTAPTVGYGAGGSRTFRMLPIKFPNGDRLPQIG